MPLGNRKSILSSLTIIKFPVDTDFSTPNGEPSAIDHQPGGGRGLIFNVGI